MILDEVCEREAHMREIETRANETHSRVYQEAGALCAYRARNRVYGYAYPGSGYSKLSQPNLCWAIADMLLAIYEEGREDED